MNGHCCQSRFSLLKWPALLTLALILSQTDERPVMAADQSSASSQTVQEGPVRLTAHLDKSSVRIAEPFRLTLTAAAPQGTTVRFPEPGKQLGDFLITNIDDTFDVPTGTDRTWMRVLTLESLRSDARALPAITLTYQSSDDNGQGTNIPESRGTISSPTLPITIISEAEATADPTRFRDIKGLAELEAPQTDSHGWAITTVAGLFVLAVAGLCLLLIRRRSQTPDQWALHELDRLASSGLIESSDFDAFFCGATDILRKYIERQFAIHAPQLTTREFLTQTKGHADLDVDQRQLIHAFLKMADVVKFAQFNVNATDAERALTHCRAFIQQTSQAVTTKTNSPRSTKVNSECGQPRVAESFKR